MKLSTALHAALATSLVASSKGLRAKKTTRKLQQESILSYAPLTQVTDAAAIDLDQVALESMLPIGTPEAMAQALSVYTSGGFSSSYAILTLNSPISTAIDFNITVGTPVSGTAFGRGDVTGVLMEPLSGGDTQIVVKYDTGDEQRSYVGCQVGGSPNPILDGCFASGGDVIVGDPEQVLTFTFEYTYDVLKDNQNARTLQSLSTSAKENLYDCDNCPYSTYRKFYNYYKQFDYGNQWIMAAFNRVSTGFANGNADFSAYAEEGFPGIVEAIKKGTVFLNVYMEVVKSMENAVDRCQAGDDSKVQSWDEAVAFYVGSMAKVTNGNDGNFLYTNAKKRCRNFGTCNGNRNNAEALANTEIIEQFMLAQRHLADGACEEVALATKRITDLMAVPLIQGTLRFAYLMDQEGIIDARADVTSGTFAASILPLVHSCSPVDAQIVYSNMRVGTTSVNFTEVKSSLERNYRCMGLTCGDIGGLLSEEGEYVEGAEPCDDATMTFNEIPEEVFVTEAPETGVPTTAAPVETEAPTAAPVVNTTVQVFDPNPPRCPPCSQDVSNEPITASKSLSECPILLEQQRDSIGRGCECACFVDSEFAFCAQESITYTGSGSLVGPCEVELEDSLIEAEAETDLEDFVAPTEEPEPVNATDAEEAVVDPNELNIAFVEGTSSGRATLLSGFAASVAIIVSMAIMQ